ncbi:MAG: tetratricopeptide repeat protein [Anaerolineae bacterium]|nr:tetratricopeptide repeat protein [Anaerolineae bacterium]
MSFLDKILGKDPEKLYSQAKRLVDQSEFEKAARKLELARERAPQSAAIWFFLGFCYSRMAASKKRTEAELLPIARKIANAYQRAVELAETVGGLNDEQIAKACWAVALFYRQQQENDKAVAYCEKGTSRNPRFSELQLLLSSCYLFQGRHEEAEEVARAVVEREPDNAQALAHWKALRETVGKDDVDLPEEDRKRVYADFMETQDGKFIGGVDLARLYDIAYSPFGTLDKMAQTIGKSGEEAREAAIEEMLQKYDLKQYELLLIEEEGRQKKWPL